MTVTDAELSALIAGLGTTPDRAGPAPDESPTDAIRRVVRTAESGSARSQQRALGPSEMGGECDRELAYKLLDIDPAMPPAARDNWLATVGTAVHAWLADAFEADNERLGRRRWIVEERVFLTDGYSGSCDLYDSDTGRVIDHKILGVKKLTEIRDGKVPSKYRVQLHLYGYGHERAGRQVREVMLAVYPRSDNLAGDFGGKGLTLWSEAYDQAVAVEALARLSRISALALQLDVLTHPQRWALIPAAPGDACRYCPFRRPGPDADASGCPGDPWS